jgi:hypothetical protein
MDRPNRRPRIIGPFFIIALLLSVGLLTWQRQQKQHQIDVLPPPVIEHQVIGSSTGSAESMPRPDLVLDRADTLKLSADQRQKLQSIIAQYRKEAAPLQEQLSVEQDRWSRVDVEAMGKDRPSGQQIAEHLARYSELSGRLTQLRYAYWPQVAPVLSAWQRHEASLLWVSELRGHPLP